jgi:hypothetical protein
MEVKADVQPTESPVILITRPLMVQELVWAGIQWVAGNLDDKKVIHITTGRSGEGAHILIGPVASIPSGTDEATASIATEQMTQALQAQLSLDPTSGMLQIHLASLQAPP